MCDTATRRRFGAIRFPICHQADALFFFEVMQSASSLPNAGTARQSKRIDETAVQSSRDFPVRPRERSAHVTWYHSSTEGAALVLFRRLDRQFLHEVHHLIVATTDDIPNDDQGLVNIHPTERDTFDLHEPSP